jgi:hypothetical protein
MAAQWKMRSPLLHASSASCFKVWCNALVWWLFVWGVGCCLPLQSAAAIPRLLAATRSGFAECKRLAKRFRQGFRVGVEGSYYVNGWQRVSNAPPGGS